VALLAFLLLHRTSHLTRDAVAFALWPDEAESDARTNLRRHLHLLGATFPPSDVPYFTTVEDTIRWNPEIDLSFDVDEFERLADDDAHLAEAVAMYAGDLLPTVYDDWVFPIRDRLRQRYLSALERLMLASRSRRDFAAGITYATAILHADEWREDAVRALATIRYESGDRAGALRELDAFEARLSAEMHVEPMPETIALRATILRGNAVALGHGAAIETTSTGAQLPFVGRSGELETLRGAWQRAARGRGEVVFLAGEAGIGKTRLAREVSLLAGAQGGRVLRGATSSPEATPYAAIVDALRDALPLLNALDVRPIWLAALAILVPELALGRDDLPMLAPLDPERERLRLFEAMTAVFAALARQRPMLLLIEDVHWAGDATLAALEYLARRSAGMPALIVATYRSTSGELSRELGAMRRRLQLENVSQHLQVGGLDVAAIVELARGLTPIRDSADDVGRDVHALSGGNPLFAAELLRERAESGTLEVTSRGLSSVIEARLARLPETTMVVARVASAIGATFEIDVVTDACGWDETTVLDALGILLERQIARETGRTRFAFAFTHALIATTIYGAIEPEKARLIRARVAESIERLAIDADAVAATLAAHFDAAGKPDRAIPYYLSAARRAFAIFANNEALAAATRGLELVAVDRDRFDLLALRESILGRLGERDLQRADLNELEALAAARDDAAARCDVLRRRADLAWLSGDISGEGRLLAEFAAAAAAIGDPASEAMARFAIARNLVMASNYDEANEIGDDALARYRALGDPKGEVEALCLLSEIAVNRGLSDRVRQSLSDAQEAAEAAGDQDAIARVAMARATASIMQRDFADARHAAERALERYRAIGDRGGEADSLSRIATALAMLLRFDESREHFAQAADVFRSTGSRLKFAYVLFNQCSVEIQSGLLPEAEKSIASALTLFEEAGDERGIAVCRTNSCMIRLLLGDPADARAVGRRALADARAIENPLIEAAALANLGNAERELGETRAALEHMHAAIAIRHRLGLSATFEELGDLALTQLASGDLEASRSTADDIIARAPKSGDNTVWPHYCYWAAARIYHAIGETAHARSALELAVRNVEEQREALGEATARRGFDELATIRAIVAAHEEARWP
jgi:DNA-binding SARP family transcriptional activator/tetratricopeptide (TPR) repeat protein